MNENTQQHHSRISEGEFRHYVFAVDEIFSETQRFLERMGYQSKPSEYLGLVQPDFRYRRKADGRTYEIVGMIRGGLDEAVDALVKLAAIKGVKKEVDCVLVLPPINEYLLIEFLTEEKGRWYFGVRDARLVVWFCNPDNHTMICPIGAPSDKEFQKHFYMNKMSFDDYMSVRAADLVRDRLLAEEEDDDD